MRDLVFPKDECNERYISWDMSYDQLIKSFEFTILLEEHENNYQGDSWYLFENDDTVGYLCFGWGSCSGCDALQSCTSRQEITDLRDSLYKEIKWFSSKAETLKYFNEKDWSTDYSWSQEKFRIFLVGAKEILGASDK